MLTRGTVRCYHRRMNRLLRPLAGLLAIGLVFGGSSAEDAAYAPDWSSLNTRPVPQWWQDAKLGIFVHWGVYAVPAYAPAGNYAEWYGESMNPVPSSAYIGEHHAELRAATRAWHEATYGADFDYADFAPMWRAELFDPAEWASLFAEAGAGYVVLTSKHHDGFALWPSEEASKSWGRPWNAVEVGPERDIVGELTEAVRAEGMRAGLYYSLYEWYNPTYTNDRTDRETIDAYVADHFLPQVKDLVARYQPDVLWGDGSWDHPSSVWRTPELMAWMFGTQANGPDVVINDRWGEELRGEVGIATSEYGAGLEAGAGLWEESRGMGASYGYNRMERAGDYASGEELVLTLVDVVSRGGNLLLDVGPAADGRIPPIQEERLRHIGAWMDTYGEGIRGTRPYRGGAQWTEGPRPKMSDAQFKAGYDVLRLTVAPEEGEARPAVFLTQKDERVFAFATRAPKGTLRVEGIGMAPDGTVRLMGQAEPLAWTASDGGIAVTVPPLGEDRIKRGPPYGFALTGVR